MSDGFDFGNVFRRFGDYVVEEIREAMEFFVLEFVDYIVVVDSLFVVLCLIDLEGFFVSIVVFLMLILKMLSFEDDE